MITKNLIITKDLCTYTIIFLHQEIILRDHAMSYRPRPPRHSAEMVNGIYAAGRQSLGLSE
jgi:hypothetical protein